MGTFELLATFESEDTAREIAKALNAWFHWVVEGDPEDCPEIFERFDVTTEDYVLEAGEDVNWEEAPVGRSRENTILISMESEEGRDTVEELLEALGSYDVTEADPSALGEFEDLEDFEDESYD